jgi:hypothetical protein
LSYPHDSWALPGPSAVEMRFQDPELLIDPAREVGVDGRRVGILDIRGECNVTPHRPGVRREALRQRPHLGLTIDADVGRRRHP